MNVVRHVVVLDAADVATVSGFWAALLGGRVVDEDPNFHCVVDADDRWILGVQHAPDHLAPEWPDGQPQQLHIDLHVDDPAGALAEVGALGARPLWSGHDPGAEDGHHVFADPAGHPFCISWGHPDDAEIRAFVADIPRCGTGG